MSENNYVYAASNLKCRESKMLRSEDYVRLLEADSITDAVAFLTDRGYFTPADADKSIDVQLNEKEIELFDLIKSFSLPETELFILQNTFYNIKAALKCVFDSTSPEDSIKTPAADWTFKIYEKVREQDFGDFPQPFDKIILDACEVVKKGGSGQDLEKFVDGKFYETGISLAGEGFFKSWFELLQSLGSIDAEAQNKKINFLKERKNNVFGIDSIFGYYFCMLNEIRNVRLVLYGKRAGIDSETLKERLCITYV